MPKRTIEKQVAVAVSCIDCSTCSAQRLVAPMTLVGLTALSVETSTKDFTLFLTAAWAVVSVPSTLLLAPSMTLCSTIGTCL